MNKKRLNNTKYWTSEQTTQTINIISSDSVNGNEHCATFELAQRCSTNNSPKTKVHHAFQNANRNVSRAAIVKVAETGIDISQYTKAMNDLHSAVNEALRYSRGTDNRRQPRNI